MYRLAAISVALLLTANIHPQNTSQPAALKISRPDPAAVRPLESIVPGHLVVLYRNGVVPADADALLSLAGANSATHLRRFGLSALHVTGDESLAITRLRSLPGVAAVLHDRYVTAHTLQIQSPAPQTRSPIGSQISTNPTPNPTPDPVPVPVPMPLPLPPTLPRPRPPIQRPLPSSDTFYNSPQGWAILQSGGYGANIPGGPSLGPWNISLGAGARIAILDSGLDATHPDIAPNLLLNLSEVRSEVRPSAFPSPCDDGSPQDQQGHGTFVASLAAGALGPTTGQVIGVAPHAGLLNIKVLQRMPAYIGATLTSQCEAGQAAGLLSWVLQGIDDALANHATVISLSLGTLVDLNTGDGAGWKAQFDSIAYAATQAGAVLVAAVGNDGLDLSAGRFIELPAQARSVLPVTASTNPACAEDVTSGATCRPGPVTRPYYSNFGSTLNAIAAPGGSLPAGPDTAISGFVRGACSSGLPNTFDGLPSSGLSFGCFGLGHTPYLQAFGTSAAAPLVAGAVAILHAARTDLTAAQLIATLQSTATHTTSMAEPQLNLPAAIAAQLPNVTSVFGRF